MPSCFPKAATQVCLLVCTYVNVATKGCCKVYVFILVGDLHAEGFVMHGGASHWAREFVGFVCDFAGLQKLRLARGAFAQHASGVHDASL